LKVVKSSSYGALPIHLFRHFRCRLYRLATVHSVRQTKTERDRQTDIIMPIAPAAVTSMWYINIYFVVQKNRRRLSLGVVGRWVNQSSAELSVTWHTL